MRRWPPLSTLAVLLVLMLAGCAGSGSGISGRGDDRDARNRAEWDTIAGTLRKLPGVSRVDGGYRRDASNPGGAAVLSITVEPGTDLQRTADDAVRSLWLSRLDPITSATVTVGTADKPKDAIDRHVDFKFERKQLTASYGPRPPSN
ncbi:MAG TPA: hypothetical protein VMU51_18340 [Mycobacteriales bacterium]|nr:hypothetical protein [Mycobacteriales bacterium]